ncbi:phosphoribosylamine--glycine ligase [Candidatus Microgenomates bacterium]|nr:MAG: phosphoribosylamine--glycine ligase [Candidatus Microgenomates bacterium]
MNILIIGSGGREHALAQTYSKSKKVKKVLVAPGNDLMNFKNNKIQIFPNIKADDFDSILDLAKRNKIDLVDVAGDAPIAAGFVDKLKSNGFMCFGPSQKASEIEWNKKWARDFMQKYNLPTPVYKSFSNQEDALKYISSNPEKTFYIKASGLALGKGAIKVQNKKEAFKAIASMKQFGKSGEVFLIEECLTGEEFSLFAVCDGKNYQIIKTAQDHKTVYENDQGPNTGGMGCVTQPKIITSSIIRIIENKILTPFMEGMQNEKRPYHGILYLGGILNPKGEIKIIEFNARWGDPEAEVILPSLKSDYLDIVEGVLNSKINKTKISFDAKTRISIAGCSSGYPNDYSNVKDKEILGLEKAMELPGITIYGAGIKRKGPKFFADGGRIFHLVSEGKNIKEARKKAYKAMSLISIQGNNLHYRTDIGWRDMEKINQISSASWPRFNRGRRIKSQN